MRNLFEEHQKQRRLIPWLLVAFLWAISIWHLHNNGLSKEQLILDILILIILPLVITSVLYLFKLSIIITNKNIKFKMFPFHWKYQKIRLTGIKMAIIKEYNKDHSFVGWGFGVSFRRRYKSYTVNGYKGIEITLNDGAKIFLGTQKPESLIECLNN